jgi:hypothetical protein
MLFSFGLLWTEHCGVFVGVKTGNSSYLAQSEFKNLKGLACLVRAA